MVSFEAMQLVQIYPLLINPVWFSEKNDYTFYPGWFSEKNDYNFYPGCFAEKNGQVSTLSYF